VGLSADGLDRFAADVGATGPVAVEGGRTQWDVGGQPAPGTRVVTAPRGVVAFEPAEMTVRVGAGTPVAELCDELRESGQTVALPDAPGATVGGVLSVGHSDVRRLGRGPVRDVLLEARYVSADGALVKAGGPTVKNVSGFDLCRLLVGSLGTLGLLGEVVLRTRPAPRATRWLRGPADPFALRQQLHGASSILWDGSECWVLLEGHVGDVDAERALLLADGMVDAAGPPELPPHRWSVDPGLLSTRGRDGTPDALGSSGAFVAEVGVGVVHATRPAPPRAATPAVARLSTRLKAEFDPAGRLNPGRAVWS
jgi:glycolate oxidase FAD binding subunit